MAYAITKEKAEAKLALWMEADEALATGQSYSIDVSGTTRQLTRADAAVVQARIEYWARMVTRLSKGSAAPRVRYAVPE